MGRGRFAQAWVASLVVACGLGACVAQTSTSEQIERSSSAISAPPGIPCAARADAVIANTGEVFSNSGSLVDSYQSSLGLYGGTNIGSAGNVQAAEAIVHNGGVIDGTQTPNVAADLVIAPVPAGATNLPLGSKTPGSLNLTTASESITLEPGTYVVENLTVVSPGAISISPAGPVLIWVTGTLNLGGNENLDGVPENLEFLVTSSGTDNVNVHGELFGFIYAPTSVVNLDSNVFGGVVGSTVNLNAGASVHFDQNSVCPIADAGSDAAHDAPADASKDATLDASDASHDGAADVAIEASLEAGHDASADVATDTGVEAGHDASADVSVDVATDTGVEAGHDASADVSVDVAAETGADSGHDASADVSSDVLADVAADTGAGHDASTDVSVDVSSDVASDTGGGGGGSDATADVSSDVSVDASVDVGVDAPTCTAASCDTNNPCSLDTCNSNGTCSHTPLSGTSCSAGNSCFASGACESGTCVGTNPVVCTASDQCHVAGTCDPTSGVCSNPTEPDGTACNDGNLCDLKDTCQSGTCAAGSSVICTASDSCHGIGTCNPGTGVCSNPPVACSDAGAPALAGPTLNGTVASNLASMAAPLFTTPDGGTGAINLAQIGVIRGRVFLLPSANPFPGVTVSALGHPEYGTATTGSDGSFNLAVNGGGQITVVYTPPSGTPTYFPVQRHTPTKWQEWAVLPDVYMTPEDPNANPIAMSNATWQAAQGSTITDPADQNGLDGGPPVSPTLPHTARLFFPAGTTASLTYGACGGSGAPGTTCSSGVSAETCAQGTCVSNVCTGAAPASLTVRATEYTVGATGLAAMPSELPPNTGYTYAVELSADEAISAGASGLSFNQPVSFYVEDFIGFGAAQAGTANPPVPVGYYDRASGQWVPSPDGNILEITGFSGACPGATCTATVNQTGTSDAGTSVTLSADELTFLGQTYQGTATPFYLWRFSTQHFSGWDANWPFGPPPDPPVPPGPPPTPNPPPPDPDPCDMDGGSVIECENQILAQEIAVPGTPYALRYQSERAPGRLPGIQIPLTGAIWPPSGSVPLRVDVQIAIAGQSIALSYPAASLTPNQTAQWTWNQKDAAGNTLVGMQPALVTVSYVYQAQYMPALGALAFTPQGEERVSFEEFTPTGTPLVVTPIRGLNQISLSLTTTVNIGVQDAAPLGLGGWTMNAHHVYDPVSQTLWRGDGKRRTFEPSMSVIQSLPGITGAQTIIPAVASDGTIYEAASAYANSGVPTVNKVDSSGNVTVVAGGVTGNTGPYAPCTPLDTVSFAFQIQSIAISPSGLLYEASGSMINVIDPVAGTIKTIAGTGQAAGSFSDCQDAPIATQGILGSELFGLAAAPDGSVYVVDSNCNTLRRVGLDGSLDAVTALYAADGSCPGGRVAWSPGQLAPTACLAGPTGVAVAKDGSIYVSDAFPYNRVSRIDPKSGVITTYAGSPNGGPLLPASEYDGELGTQIQFGSNSINLAVGADGTVYATDTAPAILELPLGEFQGSVGSIYGIDPLGVVHLVAGGSSASAAASSTVSTEVENAPAVGNLILQPGQLAVSPNGSVLYQDSGDQAEGGSVSRIRAVHSAFPSYSPGGVSIPNDDGSEVYVFNNYGQHLSTVDPVTGATLRTFQYNANSQLSSITETRGGTTTIGYSGTTVTITPPFSNGTQLTTLTLDQVGGHAIALHTPAGETTQFTYSNGLMTSLTDPKSNLHSFKFDSIGRLIQDTDPTSASILLQSTIQTAQPPATGGIEPLLSWSTAVTSGARHVTNHEDFTLTNGSRQRVVIAPSGATATSIQASSNLWTVTAPDGMFTSTQLAPDPQFGMLDAYPGSVTRTTPSGTSYTSTRTRTSTGSALAPSQILDLTTMNGSSTWSSTFTAATGGQPGQWLYVSPASRQRIEQLDSVGRVTSIAYPGTTTLPTTSFVYDGDGRVQTVTVTANGGASTRTTSMTYDQFLAGYLATVKDPTGNVTAYDRRDNDGRVLDTQLPDFANVPQSHVAMSYDLNGNLATMTVPPATPLSSVHAFGDTPVDLLASYTPPQVSSTTTGTDPELATLATSYTYNADRLITATVVPEGTGFQAVTQDYDTFGRLGSMFDPLSNVTTTYQYATNAGGVSTDQIAALLTSDGVVVTNTFDGFLKTQTRWSSNSVSGAVNWTYDNFFRPATLQVGGTGITYAYDPDSLYAGTSSPSFRVTRDVAGSSLDGLPRSATLGTVSETWTYDGFGAVASYTVQTSDSTVQYAMSGIGIGTPITRDSLGRITSMQELVNGSTHTWEIGYDLRGRLETVTRDGTTTTYGYDPNGNLTAINGATFGTFDAQDRMVSFTPPGGDLWTLAYTNNGDLTAKASSAQSYAFNYDLSSNLRNVSSSLSSSTAWSLDYVIDGMNRRIGKAVTAGSGLIQEGLLYDEQRRVVAELDASNNVLSTFVYGLKPNVPDYMVRGGTTYRIVSDWRGDVRLVIDTTKTGAAAVVEQIDYDEWGNVTNLVDPACTLGGTELCFQPFGFAGGIWEPATQVVRFGARDFDPQARRWAQKDPIRFDGEQANIYVYVNDDPINGSDPDGEQDPGQCKPLWTCVANPANPIDTGMGKRCNYTCTNGISTTSTNRQLILYKLCPPASAVAALINSGIINP